MEFDTGWNYFDVSDNVCNDTDRGQISEHFPDHVIKKYNRVADDLADTLSFVMKDEVIYSRAMKVQCDNQKDQYTSFLSLESRLLPGF